jgi:hypothetical protein
VYLIVRFSRMRRVVFGVIRELCVLGMMRRVRRGR